MTDIASIIGDYALINNANNPALATRANLNNLVHHAQHGDQQAMLQLATLMTALQGTAHSFNVNPGASPDQHSD